MTQNGPMRGCPGASAGSGGEGLCAGAAGLAGGRPGAAGSRLGHRLETRCLRAKPAQRRAEPREGEGLNQDQTVGVAGSSWVSRAHTFSFSLKSVRIEFLSLATGRTPIHGAHGLPSGALSGETRQTVQGGLLQEGCVLRIWGPGLLRASSRWGRAVPCPLVHPQDGPHSGTKGASGPGSGFLVPWITRVLPSELSQPQSGDSRQGEPAAASRRGGELRGMREETGRSP